MIIPKIVPSNNVTCDAVAVSGFAFKCSPNNQAPCPPPPPIFRAKLKSLPLVPHFAVTSAREYISSDLKAQLSSSFKLDHQKLDIYLKQRALIFWTDAIKMLAAGKSSTFSCSFALKPCWLTFRGVSLYRNA